MWYNPAAFWLERRDVIGAWLICGAIAVAFFGYPAVTSAIDTWAASAPSRPHLKMGRPAPVELMKKQRCVRQFTTCSANLTDNHRRNKSWRGESDDADLHRARSDER